MNRSRLSCFVSPALAVAFLMLAAGTAAAQGTMTPTQPPGTPNQPPPGTPNQPPPVEPAQPAQPAQPTQLGPAAGPHEEGEPSDAPPARTGFQMAIRPGVAIPAGDTAKDSALSDYVGPQFSTTLDIGGKFIPNLFVGGYLGLGIGGAGGKLGDACSNGNVSCTAVTLRIGIQAQYHILPDQKINPWVGYGIGYEATSLSASANGNSSSITAGGVEFAHLMGGVDFRLSRVIGIGPVLDLSVGQYSKSSGSFTTSSGAASTSSSNDIKDKTLHEWITIGGKITFWP